MHPVLFEIAGVPIRAFGVMLVIGFFLAIQIAKKRAPRWGVTADQIWEISFWLIVFGVLGARVLFIAQEWGYYSKNSSEIWTLKFDGMTSFGGVLFGLPTLALWCKFRKLPMRVMLDIFGVPFLVASALGRLGCFLNGCCFGHLSDSWCAVHFVGTPGTHIPAQLFDLAMLLVGAWILTRVERNRDWSAGVSAGLAFAIFGLSRFIYEFWRAGTVSEVERKIASSTYWGDLPITEAQAVALVICVGGVILAWISSTRSRLKATPIGSS